MKIELTAFKNTIARKIFFLFILLALLPVSLFAFFSIQQVDKITIDNIQLQLQNDAKSYIYTLDERLVTFDFAITQLTSEVILNNQMSDLNLKSRYTNWFDSLILVADNTLKMTYWGKPPTLIPLSNDETHFLQQGKALLKITKNDNTKAQDILLMRQVSSANDSNALLIGVINQNRLWGDDDSFDLRKVFCVVSNENAVLFCSESDIQNTLLKIISQTKLISRGRFSWSDSDIDMYVGYTSLFLQYNFFNGTGRLFLHNQKQMPITEKDLTGYFIALLLPH